MPGDLDKEPTVDPSWVLKDSARPRILLGLRAEGPLSATELSRSPIGRGVPARVYDYHLKQLVGCGLVKVFDHALRKGETVRFAVTDHLTQSLLDAAALASISEVLASIPPEADRPTERPYLDAIGELIQASGRHEAA